MGAALHHFDLPSHLKDVYWQQAFFLDYFYSDCAASFPASGNSGISISTLAKSIPQDIVILKVLCARSFDQLFTPKALLLLREKI
mmetsp:Transcript_43301/g.31618  ORF Transcript_43301/g.31618 Transcript_43301/m.31618 type:complete len:85 (-) Transcript_43301:1873-2127(-)